MSETIEDGSIAKTGTDDIEILPKSEQSDVLEDEDMKQSDETEISPSLYKDFSGIDTESFIMTTLRNNPKDRTLLLTLEKVFQDFISNEEQTSHQFQAMNSCKISFF